ncbi:MAG: PHP domain-containing protein [bacterium]|nr:PHP domain-containing protein [bacterium]
MTAEPIPFVHLHSHFWGSYSDSALSIPEGLDRASELGQTAMAVTDHGELAFAPRFYRACLERGMRPLLGCECYFVRDARESIERDDAHRNHLVLIAKDARGWRNLVSLTSAAWLDNCFRGARGLVDWALLERHHEGLVCLSACYYGSFPLAIIRRGLAAGLRELRRYLDLFGGDFHPELSRLGFEEQEISNAAIVALAPRYGLRPVATNDVHYPHPEDWIAHDIISKTRFGRVTDFSVVTRSIWLKSAGEMLGLGFDDAHLRNAAAVAGKCDLRLPGPPVSPPVLHGSPAEDLRLLAARCRSRSGRRRGARERRLGEELRLVGRRGLAGAILAAASVADRFRRRGGVRAVGPGDRFGGTAIAAALGLSDPERPPRGAPDADAFSSIRLRCPDAAAAARHVLDALGGERACRAAEMVPIGGGEALRFAAEVGGVPEPERRRGLAGADRADSVEANLRRSAPLRRLCDARPAVLRWARRIEGIPRRSRPAAGAIVMTDGPLRELVPLKRHGAKVMAQYDVAGARLAGLATLELVDGVRPSR